MGLPIEHRWELAGSHFHYTAKHVEEIPPERSEHLSDTMAPVEELTSVLGCIVPWTLSAFTRRGRERKMRRWERKCVNPPAPTRLVPLAPQPKRPSPMQTAERTPPLPPPRIPGLGRPETTHEGWFSRAITWLLSRGEG